MSAGGAHKRMRTESLCGESVERGGFTGEIRKRRRSTRSDTAIAEFTTEGMKDPKEGKDIQLRKEVEGGKESRDRREQAKRESQGKKDSQGGKDNHGRKNPRGKKEVHGRKKFQGRKEEKKDIQERKDIKGKKEVHGSKDAKGKKKRGKRRDKEKNIPEKRRTTSSAKKRGRSSAKFTGHGGKGRHDADGRHKGSSRPLMNGVFRQPRMDDADGHLIYQIGCGLQPVEEFPHGRYEILAPLGEGTFGKVLECWDNVKRMLVAIKVVRSIRKYREAAKSEIRVLEHIAKHDPNDWYHCVRLFRWFDYEGHVCIVFEKLGPSLYECLRESGFKPFTLDQVRSYAFQLLESVALLHSLTLVHTDVKPENILIKNREKPDQIKLIDFGSATFNSRHHSAIVSTRHYRAPEVILGLGWNYACDLWSVGCVLLELFTGKALFQTHQNSEHLAMMSCTLGPFPDDMIRRADPYVQKYFIVGSGEIRSPAWPVGVTSDGRMKSQRPVPRLSELVAGRNGNSEFLDLLEKLLAFEPRTRCTSKEALQHPFFRGGSFVSEPGGQ